MAENSGRSSASAWRVARLFALFEQFKTSRARADHGGGKPGKLGDLDAIGAVGDARHHFMQEDHLAIPFAHLDRGIGEMRRAVPASAVSS